MKRGVLVSILVAACCLLPGAAGAESARGLVARGNGLYESGKFEEAKKLYEEAAAKDPGAPEVWYDLGNARYKLNDFKGAAEAYQQATTLGRDPDLLSRGEFNLGNTAFRQGEAAETTDPEAAMQAFQESIGHFRAALDHNAGLKEAGRNLEVSKLRLREVEGEMQRQQAAKEGERQKQEEMAKELKQMAEEQQRMADQSREEAGKEQPDDQAMAEQADQQAAMREKTNAMGQQLGKDQEQQQAAKELEQAEGHQQEAGERLREKRPEEAAKAQEEAAKALAEAERHLTGQEEQKPEGERQEGAKAGDKVEKEAKEAQEEKGEKQSAADPKEEGQPSEAAEAEPVDRTAQELLNEERENAVQRRSRETTSGEEAVDKDW